MGASLLFHGGRLLVGSPHWSAGPQRGGAVLERRGAQGLALLLEDPSGAPGTHFGAALAGGEGWLAVGAPLAGPAHAGRIHLLRWAAPVGRGPASGASSPGALLPGTTVEEPGLGLLAGLGSSLAGSGELLLAGAPRAGGASAFHAGAVRLLRITPAGWASEALSVHPSQAGDERGFAVALDGAHAAVGAPGGGAGGEVLLWDRVGSSLVGCRRVLPASPRPGARFGAAVAVSGDWLAVGAPGPEGAAWPGAVHTFHLDPWGLVPGPVFELPGSGAEGLGSTLVACAGGFLAAAPRGNSPTVVRLRPTASGSLAVTEQWCGEPGTALGTALVEGPGRSLHAGAPGLGTAPGWLLRTGGTVLVARRQRCLAVHQSGAFGLEVHAWSDGGLEARTVGLPPAARGVWEGLVPGARVALPGSGLGGSLPPGGPTAEASLSAWLPVDPSAGWRLRHHAELADGTRLLSDTVGP
ncbi:MAG: hypothetical protein ISQ08_11860 [Planctomycetes bacterium]|nr:hypothetical protein [Planctomycetota bacterium]